MQAEALVGLWEFEGYRDDVNGSIVFPDGGSNNAELREFLCFDSNGSFFFAKYPRAETIYFDPGAMRFECEVDGLLLRGTWRLEGNRLVESVTERGESVPREQTFDIELPSSDHLIVKEPTGKSGHLLSVVYSRGDVERFPAPLLSETADAGCAGLSTIKNPADVDAATEQIQAEQFQVEMLLTTGKHNSAQRLAQRSLRHCEQLFGADHPNTAACLATLGACLVKLGQSGAAIPIMERARRIYEAHFGPDDLMTASALNNLAPAYRDSNNLRASLEAARAAVRIRWAAIGTSDSQTATSVQNLGLAFSGLGLLSESMHCYFAARAMLIASLGPEHPRTEALQRNIERLTEAVDADRRFQHESLPQAGPDTDELERARKLVETCDQMLTTEVAQDLFTLAYGRPAHTESYQHFMFAIREQQAKTPDPAPDRDLRLQHLREAQRRLREFVRVPQRKFSGFLKRVNRSALGPKSLVTLQYAFPNFIGDIEHARRRDEALSKHGIDPRALPSFNDQKRKHAESHGFEIKFVERQFRRYSGENNLPSQRYSSVCVDDGGDDRQTLCRELFEYTDPRIPGWVFVTDTWDAQAMQALYRIGMARPLVPGIFVFLLPPPDDDQRKAFHHFLGPVLSTLHGPFESASDKWNGLSLVFIPTEQFHVELADTLDLRQPDAQEWLFQFFREGDGAVSIKAARRQITSFADMLPALVYPEYGGSGVTKSIGSWLRSAGIQGLVFPSARSNASIEVDEHSVVRAYHGWNFVDYREIELVPDLLVHTDYNDWYGFVAGRQGAPKLRQQGKSWALDGVEERYEHTRGLMLELLKKSWF